MRNTLSSVHSKDGTTIAFERTGEGPPIVVVGGAFNDRTKGAPLAQFLEHRFSTFNYDRRGRGDSDDTLPYAIDREIDDLEAVIAEAGGSAFVFGFSSGAVLALKAAARGAPIARLALYEPPPAVDASRPRIDHAAELAALVAAGRCGDAVDYFQRDVIGMPAELVAQLRGAPFRPALEAMAHTLVYDMTIMGAHAVTRELSLSVNVPTLVIAGGDSPPFMHAAAQVVAQAVPNAEYRLLPGQVHEIVPEVLGPVLEDFFFAGTAPGLR